MKVACHYNPDSSRSRHIAHAMATGCDAIGLQAQMVKGFDHVAGDVCVAYGWARPDLFQAYRTTGGHYVYVDLGWWDRKPPGKPLAGFHKLVVDGREPDAYFRRNHPDDRWKAQGIEIRPWTKSGRHMLIAGMSAKSAGTRGWQPHEWEVGMVELLQAITPRPIVYRPKPSWPDARPIPGTIYSPPEDKVEVALRDCWMAVTLHSNVAVDALIAGIPINAKEGVAREFSTPLNRLEHPTYRDDRAALMADIAYCQWSIQEMMSGAAWRHLLKETPLCD